MPKILVIEDILSLQQEIIEILRFEGFETFGAGNGKEGIEIARNILPDLIICDVSMPIMDGYSTLAEIQNDQNIASTPFIFLTAHGDLNQIRKGMDLGADDYLTKPVSAMDLTSMVKARLRKKAHIDHKLQSEVDNLRTNITRALPHELRTPLNGIMGFAELLADELKDQPDLQEMAEGIYDSAQILHRVIQNFLIYAELEILVNKNIVFTDQSTSSQEAIASTAHMKAKEVGRLMDLKLNLTDGLVQISKCRLSKIVEEIIDNSFKFSNPHTPVEVTSISDRSTMFITFTDYGRGMTPNQINSMGAYTQFDRKIYEQQGTGLGLAIVKLLAKVYGGSLEIASDLDVKTIVTISLPLVTE